MTQGSNSSYCPFAAQHIVARRNRRCVPDCELRQGDRCCLRVLTAALLDLVTIFDECSSPLLGGGGALRVQRPE